MYLLNKLLFFKLFLGTLLVWGCSKECGDDNTNPVTSENKIPIVMVHGMLASGDTYARHTMLYMANGYPSNILYAYDWNTLGGNNADNIQKLDELINRIIAEHKTEKIHLVGHSAGGGLAYSYMGAEDRAKKITAYVHVGSSPQSGLPGPEKNIPTMNIYSKADKIVNGSDIPGAANVIFENLDHYEVATDPESFKKIYSFFNNNKEPNTIQIIKKNQPVLSGRVVTLGENKPEKDVTVKVYKADQTTGSKLGNPLFTFHPDDDGYFKGLQVNGQDYHIFEISSSRQGFRTLYYYRQPFVGDNPNVYLRTFPPQGSIAGLLLSNLPKDDKQTVLAVFSANKAIIHQRDTLTVNSTELATAQLCAPQNSVIAMFVYDNGDQGTSGNGHPAFALFPFLRGADIFIPAGDASTNIQMNGSKMTVKNYGSASDGVIIAVFDQL